MLCVLFAGALLLAGLVADGGRVMAANADASDLAAKAARAGAQAVDPAAVRAGPRTGAPILDPAAAWAAARSYLDLHHTAGTVAVAGDTVTVTVHAHVAYTLLALSGSSGETVTQTRSAVAVRGP
jgi:hypothetical protein